MIVAVPADTPVTMPEASIVAIVVSKLLHCPPAMTFASATVLFTHTCEGPVIAETAGNAFTITGTGPMVTEQLLELVIITETLSLSTSVEV